MALLNILTRGWTASGTLYDRTGYPFSVVNSRINGAFAGGQGGPVLAGYLGGGEGSCKNGNSTCLTKSQFAASATEVDDPVTQLPIGKTQTQIFQEQIPFGFGNLTRNSKFRAPGYFDTDMSLIKTTKVAERVDFRIGASFFNILNHPNFYKPSNNVQGGSFGKITTTVTPPSSIYGSFTGSAVSGRIIQLQAGVSF
jgi:hypothetical protein